jgi:hypothetical protein
VFLQVFQTQVSSISYVFFCICCKLDVSNVDRVLHMGCA